MKCKYDKCDNELTGRQSYCSTKCKQAAYRNKSVTESVTVSPESVTVPKLIGSPISIVRDILDYGLPGCQCQHCNQARTNKSKSIINHGPYKNYKDLAVNEVNRVSLPGDPDYTGVCTQVVQVGPG